MTPEFSYANLHSDFSNTSWGTTLSQSTRFDSFRKQSGLSESEWWDLLGADVNTLRHLKLSYGITRWFCQKDPSYTPDEKYQLTLAATIHDWAESIFGDIEAPVKTGSHDEIEKRELHNIIDTFCEQHPEYTQIQSDMHMVTDTIIFTQETKLGKAFRAIELMGYCRTAIRSWKFSPETEEPTKTVLRSMATEITFRSYGKLEAMASEYPAIQAFVSDPSHQQIIAGIRAYSTST